MLTRGLEVGEEVRVIRSRADARSNAEEASWELTEAAARRCGDSGVVEELRGEHPDPRCLYLVKFADGDDQWYVQPI